MGLRRFGGPGMHGIGGVPLSSLGGGALGTYAGKLLGYSPIAYWPLWEKSGTTAECLVNPLQNGTYSSNVSTWPPGTGIGDGNTAPTFDGTNDSINAFSATLAAAFNGVEGGWGLWFFPDAGSYNDAVIRRMLYTLVDGNNFIIVAENGNNANIQINYNAGGVGEQSVWAINPTPTTWNHFFCSWSKANDRVRYYSNGTNYETDITLGNWAGAIPNFMIGATNGTPTNPYWGRLAHVIVFDRELSTTDVADIANL